MQEEWCWAKVLPGCAQVHILVQCLIVRRVWTMLLARCGCGQLVAVAPACVLPGTLWGVCWPVDTTFPNLAGNCSRGQQWWNWAGWDCSHNGVLLGFKKYMVLVSRTSAFPSGTPAVHIT